MTLNLKTNFVLHAWFVQIYYSFAMVKTADVAPLMLTFRINYYLFQELSTKVLVQVKWVIEGLTSRFVTELARK